jgi:CRP/FNR family transcriptional regulator, cyclic AMP receptor protein
MPGLFETNRAPVAILAADADLVADLEPAERERARRAVTAHTVRLDAGPWDPERDMAAERRPGDLGLLVLDGIILRALDIHGAGCAELVGAGDLIRPWTTHPHLTLSRSATWQVIGGAHLALLDRRTTALLGRWPEIVARLVERAIERTHSLAFHLAICGLTRVDMRLLAVLWNLADRWGRVTPAGVVLPLPITHRVLGQLIAARRPSVTTHLGRLRERGLIEPLVDGGWLLHGEPPDELAEIRAQLATVTGPP